MATPVIVVDTSVWIDHFRDNGTAQVSVLRQALLQPGAVALTGVVRTELLRGAAETEVPQLVTALDSVRSEDLSDIDFDHAALLFRSARSAGNTVRNVVDCLIAALCIRLDASLLHADVDFNKLAAVSPLRVVAT